MGRLAQLHRGKTVIPIVGPELVVVQTDAGHENLHASLARSLAARLNQSVDTDAPPPALNDVVVRQRDGAEGVYLHSHLVKHAQSLVMVGKFEEAEAEARASLALREETNPRASYPVQSARATIGSALVGQKRYAEAEPYLTEACEFFKQQAAQTPLTDVQRKLRVASLVQLYEVTGRPEKAADWKRWAPRSAAAAPAAARPAARVAPATAPKP